MVFKTIFLIEALNALLAAALPMRNEDCGLIWGKEIKTLTSNQALSLQELQHLIKELSQMHDAVLSQMPTDCSGAQIRGSWTSVMQVRPPDSAVRRVQCDQFTRGGGWTVVVSRNSEHLFKTNVARQALRNSTDYLRNLAKWPDAFLEGPAKGSSDSSAPSLDNHHDTVNFNKSWKEYKYGFGNPAKEYWLGNEIVHILTRDRPWEALVLLEDWAGNVAYAQWDSFRVLSEDTKYRLEVSGYRREKSNLRDGLSYHSGRAFSTIDSDNDGYDVHCAMKYGGGWWFHQCHVSHLTGTHLVPGGEGPHSLHWLPWKNNNESLKKAALMIRPPSGIRKHSEDSNSVIGKSN